MTSVPIRYQTVEVYPGVNRPGGPRWCWRLLGYDGAVLNNGWDFQDTEAALAAVRKKFPQSNTSIRLRVWRDGVWVPEDWWK